MGVLKAKIVYCDRCGKHSQPILEATVNAAQGEVSRKYGWLWAGQFNLCTACKKPFKGKGEDSLRIYLQANRVLQARRPGCSS